MQIKSLTYEGQEGKATVVYAADDPVFHGHFDDQPIVPGVALVDAVVEIVGQALGKSLWLKKIINVKFFHVVQPDQEIRLTFDLKAHEGLIKVHARWDLNPEQKIAALSCALTEEAT
jgi:3-hydroxymyristoyl/3-hydroxydecanoyl-(acyl carrier protein) dehydratase